MSRFRSDKPKPLKELLSEFIEEYPHRRRLMKGMVLSAWPEAVGEAIAEQTEKVYFKGNKLMVHVKNPAWRHEIHMKRYSIAKKLNEEVGGEVIDEIIMRS